MCGMIIDCALYRNGFREDVDGDLSTALTRVRAESDAFLWIGLHEPSTSEFDEVKKELRLHPLAIEDAAEGHQRPKIEHYGDTVFVVVKTVTYTRPHAIEVGEIMLFVGPDFVITVRHGKANPLARVRRRLEADHALLSVGGPGAVLYGVCDDVIDSYDTIAHEIEADIIELERRVFTRSRDDVTEDIYTLKREILEFRTAEDPLIPVLQEITRGRVALCEKTGDRFRSALDDLLRADQQIDSHNELVTNVLTAHLALLGKQQNEDVRKISAWAAILAVPTAIAGIYGMNFEHMPETTWQFGYPMALSVMGGLCYLLYRKLRKSGWL
jgi:magnesium transporter